MKEISKLMNYRSDVRVVDATLRDGGLVNDFRFSDEFVRDLYLSNIKAGVDYMEFGYRADKEMFKVEDFGPCKFCDDEYIRSIVGENHTDLKIAIMADVGRCNYKQDIVEHENSPVDLIRVATYLHQIPTAVDMIEDAKKKGYEVTCNIMAISNAQEGDLKVALDILGQSPVDVFYIVDSFGALYPEQQTNTAKRSVSTLTTTSSLLLQIQLKLLATVLTGLTLHTHQWAEAQATAQWSFFSVSSKIQSTMYILYSSSLRNTWKSSARKALYGAMISSISSQVFSISTQEQLSSSQRISVRTSLNSTRR